MGLFLGPFKLAIGALVTQISHTEGCRSDGLKGPAHRTFAGCFDFRGLISIAFLIIHVSAW